MMTSWGFRTIFLQTHPMINQPHVISQQKKQFQWPFQEPKLEPPIIYKAYVSGLCKGISPNHMALYAAVLPFWDPEIPIDNCSLCCNDVGKCGHGQSSLIVDIENPEGWNAGVVTSVTKEHKT